MRPEGMTMKHYAKLGRMLLEQRDRLLERAAIIQEATGCSWAEADRRTLEELEPRLPGVDL